MCSYIPCTSWTFITQTDAMPENGILNKSSSNLITWRTCYLAEMKSQIQRGYRIERKNSKRPNICFLLRWQIFSLETCKKWREEKALQGLLDKWNSFLRWGHGISAVPSGISVMRPLADLGGGWGATASLLWNPSGMHLIPNFKNAAPFWDGDLKKKSPDALILFVWGVRNNLLKNIVALFYETLDLPLIMALLVLISETFNSTSIKKSRYLGWSKGSTCPLEIGSN